MSLLLLTLCIAPEEAVRSAKRCASCSYVLTEKEINQFAVHNLPVKEKEEMFLSLLVNS